MIFNNDVFQSLKFGQKLKGYIKNIRDDNKIDLTLKLINREARDSLSQQILDHLEKNNGKSTLTDKSNPDAIYRQYSVSKSNYKKALGGLYKKRLISIDKDKIELL